MFDYTLDFRATKVGGDMYGNYTGSGTLYGSMVEASYLALVPHAISSDVSGGGPLTNISFAMYPPLTPLPPVQPADSSGSSLKPLPPIQPADSSGSSLKPLPPIQSVGNSGSGLTPLPPIQPAESSGSSLTPLPPIQPANNSGSSLTPLPPIQPADNSGSSLTPLPPIQPSTNSGTGLQPLAPLKPMPPTQARGNGTMYWDSSKIANRTVFDTGDVIELSVDWPPRSIDFDVILYTNGNGMIVINLGYGRLTCPAHLLKGVTLVNVK
jgi:hypothetical protein